MKRLFKFLLPLALSISFSVLVFADTGEDKNYIPLRDAFESNHATVKYNPSSGLIDITSGVNKYTYSFNKNVYGINSTNLPLKNPLKNIDNRAYIHYDDVAFLYEQPNDIYKNSKKNVVTTIYGYKNALAVPGITFSFVDASNNYSWIETFGYSDVENNIPVNENTLFDIGSMTKSFTALAILKLVEENKLNLDEKVVTYLPNFKLQTNPIYGGNSDDVTLRMLLSHYGGINGDLISGFFTANGYHKDYLNNFMENNKSEYMTSVPGTRNSYSNSGYTMLGYLVGQLTNPKDVFTGYNTFLQDNVLSPIGMTSSIIDMNDSQKNLMASVYLDDKTPKEKFYYVNPTPAGALFSNANDINKYLNFMLNKGTINNKEIFKAETIDKMITKSGFSDDLATMNTNLGSYQTIYNNRNYTGHGGDSIHFHSDYQLDYENKTGVFVSTNSISAQGLPNLITVFTLDSINNEKNNLPQQPASKDKHSLVKPHGIVKNYKDYDGYYLNFGNITFDDNKNIVIKDLNLTVNYKSDNEYYNENIGNISFVTIDNIDIMLINGSISSQKVNLNKADEHFNSWIGTYKVVKISKDEFSMIDSVEFIKDENNNTFAKFTALGQPSLSPIIKIDDNRYIDAGIGRGLSIVMTKSIKDGKTIINYSGLTFEKQ